MWEQGSNDYLINMLETERTAGAVPSTPDFYFLQSRISKFIINIIILIAPMYIPWYIPTQIGQQIYMYIPLRKYTTARPQRPRAPTTAGPPPGLAEAGAGPGVVEGGCQPVLACRCF